MDTENIRIPSASVKDDEPEDGASPKSVEPDDEEDVGEDIGEDIVSEDEGDEDADAEEGEEEEEDEEEDEEAKRVIREKKAALSKKKQPVAPVIEADDDEEELELMDEDYIQRVHPEAILPDSRELRAILANKDIVRRSRPILSKYEATSIVGMRAQQIAKGSTPFIDTDDTDPIEIATKELRAKLIPVIVRRIMPDNVSEYWRLTELTYYE
jgi:DNA-directed RNA polymerase I, II, and III subunit RPABC2